LIDSNAQVEIRALSALVEKNEQFGRILRRKGKRTLSLWNSLLIVSMIYCLYTAKYIQYIAIYCKIVLESLNAFFPKRHFSS